ncbi:hypothetical protein KBI51_01720 [Aerococcaceae bacterium zg-ZUI334]|uniref:hypothetical protein n=1 Tax=Aerococcaceae bacterium zg-252 TaxID=2796928 RepID=UPI001B9024B0|nr:hypothetical protein [Aerococcaceae bacterium zg-ZUI334]
MNDELGSGMRNIYKYMKLYFGENDLSIIVETTRELDMHFDYNRNAYLFKEQYRAN